VSQALENIARLAREVEVGLPIGPGVVKVDDEGDISVDRQRRASRHHFYLNGLMFHVSLTPEGDETLFRIWADVGYLPYTIQSPERRAKLQTVIRATAGLEHARFLVDENQKIIALGQKCVPGTLTMHDMMYETTLFLQNAQPYLGLIGKYL
jgi:hypothetical protein